MDSYSSIKSKLLVTGKLGVWLYHFLTHYFVRLQGGISHASPVLSGVPQGTVLGPLLFLILMGDINSGISSSSIVSFADEQDYTMVFQLMTSFLQNDLNSIYDWASCNNMSFNAQKLQYICFSLILHHLLMYTPVLVLISSDLGINVSAIVLLISIFKPG